jgi:hypothetical protein
MSEFFLLFGKFRPELWESEDLLKENIVFSSCLWGFIELLQNIKVTFEVI